MEKGSTHTLGPEVCLGHLMAKNHPVSVDIIKPLLWSVISIQVFECLAIGSDICWRKCITVEAGVGGL